MAETEGMIKDAVDSAIVDLSGITNLELGLTYKELIDIINKNYAVIDDAIDTAIDNITIDFGTEPPVMNEGTTGSTGSAETASRSDHVHPTDTSRLAVAPDGKNNLLTTVNGKVVIDTKYLPDSIVNSLEYRGTFNASVKGTLTDLEVGHYYICITAGNINPNGSDVPNVPLGENYYNEGDWAIYNGSGWDKIDNTDRILTVNGRTGNITTYMGTFNIGTTYKQGDIVSDSSGNVYVCKTENTGSTLTNTEQWLVTGRVKDVQVNGVSKLNTTTGIVAIDIDNLTSEYTSVTANTTRDIDGTTYYGFNVVETDTAFEVYKKLQSADTDMQQIVTHRVRKADGNVFVACSTTSGATVYIRKITGNIVENKLYHHHMTVTSTPSTTNPFYVVFDIYNHYSSQINTGPFARDYFKGKYSATGFIYGGGSRCPIYEIDITLVDQVNKIKIGYWMENGTDLYVNSQEYTSFTISSDVVEEL